MWLLDQWAERHILDAQTKGEFDDLPVVESHWLWMMTCMCHLNYARATAYSKCRLSAS